MARYATNPTHTTTNTTTNPFYDLPILTRHTLLTYHLLQTTHYHHYPYPYHTYPYLLISSTDTTIRFPHTKISITTTGHPLFHPGFWLSDTGRAPPTPCSDRGRYDPGGTSVCGQTISWGIFIQQQQQQQQQLPQQQQQQQQQRGGSGQELRGTVLHFRSRCGYTLHPLITFPYPYPPPLLSNIPPLSPLSLISYPKYSPLLLYYPPSPPLSSNIPPPSLYRNRRGRDS